MYGKIKQGSRAKDFEIALNFGTRTKLYEIWDAKEVTADEDKNTICLEGNSVIKVDDTYSFSIITDAGKDEMPEISVLKCEEIETDKIENIVNPTDSI